MGGGSKTITSNKFTGGFGDLVGKTLGAANWAFDKTPKGPYGGPWSADPNQLQKQAVAWTAREAPNLSQGASGIRSYADSVMRGDWLSPEKNPFLKGMAESATRDATDNYRRTILPGIDSAAISQGAYGGSRSGVATGVAAGEADKNIRDTYAGLYGQNYARERGIMGETPQMYGMANQLALAPAQAMGAAGGEVQGWQQQKVRDAMSKWNELKTAPWSGLQGLAGILQGFMPGFQQSTQSTPGAPWWQQLFQGGIGVGGLFGGL